MKKYNVIIDTIEPKLKTLSVKIEGWEIVNGELKLTKERRGFLPGQIAELEQFLNRFEIDPKEVNDVVNVLWTPEVISNYQQLLAKNEIN